MPVPATQPHHSSGTPGGVVDAARSIHLGDVFLPMVALSAAFRVVPTIGAGPRLSFLPPRAARWPLSPRPTLANGPFARPGGTIADAHGAAGVPSHAMMKSRRWATFLSCASTAMHHARPLHSC